MDIEALPLNTSCLVDANIFLYHHAGASDECTEFIDRVARYQVEAFLTTTIIAETLHRRLMVEALTKGLISSGQPLKKLKSNPAIITQLTDHSTEIEKLLRLPFRVIDVTSVDISASHSLRQTHGLFVNDSINLAAATRLGITDFVTHDTDFERVPSISLWVPTDV